MRAVLTLAVFLFVSGAFAQEGGGVSVEMAPDGRTYSIKAPGIGFLNAMFQAHMEIDGVEAVLSSFDGKPLGTEWLPNQPSPYGPVDVGLSTIRFEREGFDLLLRVERIVGSPVVLVNAGIHVFGSKPCELLRVFLLRIHNRFTATGPLQIEGPPGDWVLSGIFSESEAAKERPIAAARLLRGLPKTMITEDCSLYSQDGRGVFIGPTGKPEAFTSVDFLALADDRIEVALSSSMDVRVDPGETRWGQQIGLFFEPPREAMSRWVDWVAMTHGSRTARGGVSGWLSTTDGNPGETLLEVVEAVRASGAKLRPEAILIENAYHNTEANPMEPSGHFPRGLPFYAREIAGIKAAPGLFQDYDGDRQSRSEIQQIIQGEIGRGFHFFKIIYRLAASNLPVRGKLTYFQRFRSAFQELRKSAGEDTHLLSVMSLRKRAVLGSVDSSRVAGNIVRTSIRERISSCLWAMPLGNRWFAVDNDSFYLATEVERVSPVVGGWPMARTWMSMVGLSCGNAFTTDVLSRETFKPYWRNLEVLTPPARERTQVLDIGTGLEWPRLAGKVERDWGQWVVALLWNPENKERVVGLDLARAGLNPSKRHAVWSFWENKYLGVVEKEYKTPFLAPSASQHLVFTDLPEDSNKPVVIGSNLHIYCGAAEFKNVVALPGGMRIEFTDAGARDGSVFVYCKAKPAVEAATGLTVVGVAAAGENAWEIKLKDRVPDALQRMDLSIPEPLVRQRWFWFLSALLVLSGGFGAWKFLDSRRTALALRHEQARQQERIRIARDLHDELGATLARIVMITGSSADSNASPVLQRVLGFSKEGLQRLDEIVWAVNPARDTLDHLVDYLCKFAEEYLRDAGIRFRFETPEDLPQAPVSSKIRHAIYMVVREAIRNAVVHGAPGTVQLRIAIASAELAIEIQDDGCGFNPGSATSGNGLVNMRSRIVEIGGRFDLTTAPGSGATVSIRLPLSALTK